MCYVFCYAKIDNNAFKSLKNKIYKIKFVEHSFLQYLIIQVERT